ncbi:MAG: hypothetical protein KatS3mg123_1815 [Burkholderiales bacterium]|nr:MAG: hypothetical protein KatS3mg123_1815 [Burkholderiales bacterium]
MPPPARRANARGPDGPGQASLHPARPAPCAVCHTLRDAGASAEIGPNLDELKPDAQRVAAAVKNGIGIMPAFGGSLTQEQIQAVAFYVARASGASK